MTFDSDVSFGSSTLRPNKIVLRDDAGNPISNTRVKLRIGGENPFDTTTLAGGVITLWRASTLDDVSVTAVVGSDTYSAICVNGMCEPKALPVISSVTVVNSKVTVTASGAGATGIQYVVNGSENDLPDTYSSSAMTAFGANGIVNIAGLRIGDRVSLRAFACGQATDVLNPNTADAFTFGNIVTFTYDTRAQFTLEDQKKTYDGFRFAFKKGLLPENAAVKYYKDGNEIKAPIDVGEYTISVSIPASAQYQQTSLTVGLTVSKKSVYIFPYIYGKTLGDGEIGEYSYTHSDTCDGDEVTGLLVREAGESVGNYEYSRKNLKASGNYRLRTDPDSPMFFIDACPADYLAPEILKDTVFKSDGSRVIIEPTEKGEFGINHRPIDMKVTDGETEKPFAAELRLARGYDRALLIISCLPDEGEDSVGAMRALSITRLAVFKLRELGVTDLAFSADGCMYIVNLPALATDEVEAARRGVNIRSEGMEFAFSLTPMTADGEGNIVTLPTVSELAVNGDRALDLREYLANALLAVETKRFAELANDDIYSYIPTDAAGEYILSNDNIKAAQQKIAESLSLGIANLDCEPFMYSNGFVNLDATLVVPYTELEIYENIFPAIFGLDPYFLANPSAVDGGIVG